MGVAGLWSAWKSAKGDMVHSYTMLTINADNHAFMRQFHKPADEKRMVVILEEHQYNDWLTAPSNSSMGFMAPYLAEHLTAIAPQEKVEGLFQ
jgi:putative SOS response-associated peptidase YedK